VTKRKKPSFTTSPAHNVDALEKFILQMTGEKLTPANRAKVEAALRADAQKA
jgi:hypothetical protein